MKVSNVPFKGTPEQELQLRGVIDGLKGENGCLMPIIQKIISDGTGIPMEKVYGVATFYAQFSMSPKGEHEVSVCLGTACYVKGAGDIFDKVSEELQIGDGECTPDGKFSLDSCRCVGACGLAPVVIVGGDVYGKMTPDKIPEVLAKYI